MRRILLALGMVAALAVPNEAALIGALKFTNGVNQYVQLAASSKLNNLMPSTVLMWGSLTTISPAAQRNLFTKSSGNDQWSGYIVALGVRGEWGLSSGTSASTAATWASLPQLAANQPALFAWQYDTTTTANNRVIVGTLAVPATEATSYSIQRSGVAGSHNDSASRLVLANVAAGGTANTMPGSIYSFQVFNRLLSLAEIRSLQYRWQPRYAGCVVSYRVGANGSGPVLDECNQIHGTINGSPPVTGDVLPRVLFRRPGQRI